MASIRGHLDADGMILDVELPAPRSVGVRGALYFPVMLAFEFPKVFGA